MNDNYFVYMIDKIDKSYMESFI